MQMEEFQYMMEKLVTVISATLCLKRQYLAEIYKGVEQKLFIMKERIFRNDFVKIVSLVCRESKFNIDELGAKMANFTMQISRNRLPDYLEPSQVFLGRYLINNVVSY